MAASTLLHAPPRRRRGARRPGDGARRRHAAGAIHAASCPCARCHVPHVSAGGAFDGAGAWLCIAAAAAAFAAVPGRAIAALVWSAL